MSEEIAYMIGIVAVGFVVNYMLRALPFLIVAGCGRALPKWIERLGGIISPVIIAGLIVYSYSGSAWRTPWPYLAGVVTVVLQMWRRNPLTSIIAGTCVYMLLMNCCGCSTVQPVPTGIDDTVIVVDTHGVQVAGRPVRPEDVPVILHRNEIPVSRTIHVRVEKQAWGDLRTARMVLNYLRAGGYTRNTLVTERISASEAGVPGRPKRNAAPSPRVQSKSSRQIRYKRANE